MNDEAFEEAAVSWLTARGWTVSKDAPPDAKGSFAEFWSNYPRKIGKQAASAAWDRTVRRGSQPTEIIEGLLSHLASGSFSTEEKYIPHATTWLNSKRWLDVPKQKWTKPQVGGQRATAKAIDEWLQDGS